MNKFEEVFQTGVESIHQVNIKQFGIIAAEVMKVTILQMKPVFEVVYNQGYEDCKGDVDEAKLDKSKT
ncbi:MAG: hypothetical protein RR959_08880 [Erysipelotrichaceae bacterium]